MVDQATHDARNEAERGDSPLSPVAQDFAASGGLVPDAETTLQTPGDPLPHPPALAQLQQKSEVIDLSPYHGSAISLYNHIHPTALSVLDINLDLSLPRYLSLSTVIDIIRLIKDDDTALQDASRELLLDCLETMDEVEALPPHPPSAPTAKELARKRKGKRPAGPLDVKTLRRSTRLNKNREGYKPIGSASDADVKFYEGHFDVVEAKEIPPHLSKENLNAIGTGFLKLQPMAVTDTALLASDDDNE
jgi:hypothetical protein